MVHFWKKLIFLIWRKAAQVMMSKINLRLMGLLLSSCRFEVRRPDATIFCLGVSHNGFLNSGVLATSGNGTSRHSNSCTTLDSSPCA